MKTYQSATKGELLVSDMAWNHLINAKKKILRGWALVAALETAQSKVLQDPNSGLNIDIGVYHDPAYVFPIYNALCAEIDARTEAKALTKALEATSNDKPRT